MYEVRDYDTGLNVNNDPEGYYYEGSLAATQTPEPNSASLLLIGLLGGLCLWKRQARGRGAAYVNRISSSV